jgi:hypothetical protein
MSNKTKQTAVQWLVSQQNHNQFFDIETIEKAKEMEKEQIKDAWIDDRFPLDKDWVKQSAEQYYNETYGANK